METKIFEILDRATCMTMIATKLEASVVIDSSEDTMQFVREMQLLNHVGLGASGSYKLLVSTIDSGYAHSEIDPYGWEDSRTRITAHKYIEENWSFLKTGDVLDVEFILGEIPEPHVSEMDREIFLK